MRSESFIPGVWEEEISVSDFLNLNKKEWKESYFQSKRKHLIDMEDTYDVLLDKEDKFFYFPSLKERFFKELKMESTGLFLDDVNFFKFTEAIERKKMLDANLLLELNNSDQKSFIQPDINAVAVYGTRFIIKDIKEYLKKLDSQLQTQEWMHKKINLNRSVEALHCFEEFAKEYGVQVKKPSKDAIEAARSMWITVVYSIIENERTSFSLYSSLSVLDVFIENDIKAKKINEEQAQKLIDEFHCKIGALNQFLEGSSGKGSLNLNIASNFITKTTMRYLESASCYSHLKVPIQLLFNSKEFPHQIEETLSTLYAKGFPISFSQTLRKRNDMGLSVTPFQAYFKNYEDVVFQFNSFDLHKALLIAINGGKEVNTNTNFYQVARALRKEEIHFDTVFYQFESYLRYFITLYAQQVNIYAYYYDRYHDNPFKESLISHYPHYLINLSFHNLTKVVSVLTAVYEQKFELSLGDKGVITAIEIRTTNFEDFIGARLNEIIHHEVNRLLFYKDGNYNVTLFSELPFFEKEDEIEISSLSPISFLKTSFSGFKLVEEKKFITFLREFKDTGYTHIKLKKP